MYQKSNFDENLIKKFIFDNEKSFPFFTLNINYFISYRNYNYDQYFSLFSSKFF